jgi:hypothetical protein
LDVKALKPFMAQRLLHYRPELDYKTLLSAHALYLRLCYGVHDRLILFSKPGLAGLSVSGKRKTYLLRHRD